MRRNPLFVFVTGLLVALLLAPACSDDGDETVAPDPGTAPTFDASVMTDLEAPAGLLSCEDSMAQQVCSYLEQIDWLVMRLSRLEPPVGVTADPAKAGPWVYTWREGEPGYDELILTLTIRDLADRYTWELRATGVRYEVTYADYLLVAAQLAKNAMWGWLEEYDFFGTGSLQFRWAWSTEGTAVSVTVDVHDPFAPYCVETTIKADNSGDLIYYKGVSGEGWKSFEADWDATGAGNWSAYDEQGTVTDSGSWSVPTG